MKTTVQKPTALMRSSHQFRPRSFAATMSAGGKRSMARRQCVGQVVVGAPGLTTDRAGSTLSMTRPDRPAGRLRSGREEIGIDCPLHVDAKDQRRAGQAHHEDVQPGDDTDPQMQLEEETPGGHRQIMKLFPRPPAIHG